MEIISRSEKTSILLSDADNGQDSYVIKTLNIPNPTPSQVEQFYNEWTICRTLELLGVRKVFDKLIYEGKHAIKLEYVKGNTLDEVLKNDNFNLSSFLQYTIQIASIIGEIHQEKIVHKDICPQNIIVDPETDIVYLIDFELGTSLNLKSSYLGNPELIQGNLHYISPEQTGRMNRMVDYRSDLYSLGVTLYHLLCGCLPFEKEDPLELVHCHLAISAVPPLNLLPDDKKGDPVYQSLSSIIMKLLNKNAEERYQSAFGLKSDLQVCLKAISDNEFLADFQPGSSDFSEKFQIPQKLYGREKELNYLIEVYRRVSTGNAEMLLVSGFSGVGKSALVYEIHKPITETKGYFIEGKFDQFQRNIPYSAWIQAFDNFVQLLLTENQKTLELWKAKLLKALNNEGQILINLIPSLEKIIGGQPSVIELSPEENSRRFSKLFLAFVRVIAKEEHPFFIFLDDWQWSDTPSRELLEKILIDSNVKSLLIAGAYRSNEVDDDHPFIKTVTKIKKSKNPLSEIYLDNLSQSHINALIADTLACPIEYCKPLSNLLHSKTNGNAFFLNQMLKSLHEQDAIKAKYDPRVGMRWDWDMLEIKKMNISNNVVNLMIDKVKTLDANTQEILKLASCIGTLFPLKILAAIHQKPKNETKSDLTQALSEGLIVPMGNQYKFSHDRIKQAVYSLIPDNKKEQLHFQIGKILLDFHQKEGDIAIDDHLFDIVNQLNYGKKFVTKNLDKANLIELNLKAGIQAKQSIAYESALNYLTTGYELLPEYAWEECYELTYSIHKHLAETKALNYDIHSARKLLSSMLENAHYLEEKVQIAEFNLWVGMLELMGDKEVSIAIEVLKLCGVEIPSDPDILSKELAENLDKIWKKFETEGLECFLQLKEMEDRKALFAFQILSKMVFIFSHQVGRFEKYEYLISAGLLLSLKYGRTPNLLPLLAHLGSLFASRSKFKEAYSVSQVAKKMAENYTNFHAKVQYINRSGLWCDIYGERLDRIIPFFEYGSEVGLETGNIVGRAVCQYDIVIHKSYQGNPIDTLLSILQKRIEENIMISFNHLMIYTRLEHHKLAFFHTGEEKFRIKDGFSQDVSIAFSAPNINTGWLGLVKMEQHFWLREYEEVLDTYKKYAKYLMAGTSNIIWADHFFYISIGIVKCKKINDPYFESIFNHSRSQILKMADACPENFLHKHLLIEAEINQAVKSSWENAAYYNQAILEARKNEFLSIEALAHELYAHFWDQLSQKQYAGFHFKSAHDCYITWKAFHLAKILEENNPLYFTTKSRDNYLRSSSGYSFDIDLHSLLKASQILSSEILLSNLISKMMPILIENAGAQSGMFITIEKDLLLCIAKGISNKKTLLFDENEKRVQNIPTEIFNYVKHNRKPLILEDAQSDERFMSDIYIQNIKPKSVICLPIFFREELSHLIYLENNLAYSVFSEKHLEILRSLSSQIGISMENARLYEKQEKILEAYSTFVPHSFLKALGHTSILDVKLGDQVQKNVNILFSDIRSYTSMSEKMSPDENFNFLNAYLKRVAPAIKENNGFVSQYLGDGIMALFLDNAQDAVQAAVSMQINTKKYNKERILKRRMPIKIGIGIHTGLLMLGILGEENHQQATVVSDAVNIASRMEGLTKYYHASILITENVLSRISQTDKFHHRFLGKVQVVGKTDILSVFEIYDGDSPELISQKNKSNPDFQKGLDLYFNKDFVSAAASFKNALQHFPDGPVIKSYFEKTAKLMVQDVPHDWNGAELMTHK